MSERGKAFGCVTLLLATLTLWLSAPPAAAVGQGAVQMTITDVRPNSPLLTTARPQRLEIALTLTNTTDATLNGVTVSAVRGDPIGSQDALDSAIAKPRPPSPSLVAPLKTRLTTTLGPRATVELVLRSTTDISRDVAELCLCLNAIYPLYLTAGYPAADGSTTVLATAQTYLPSFNRPPVKAQVGWLWPLLDRPHRLAQEGVFVDDGLAAEVRHGGRLDQLLTVVEDVSRKRVPLTLVTDPDLIDELAVMSGIDTTSAYRVQTATGTVAGTGAADATSWLRRLRLVLGAAGMELDFTPFADPAVESLSRNGLSWSVGLSTTAQARVTDALGPGRTPLTDIAWPAGETLSPATLSTLVGQGTNTVVVSDRTLSRGTTGTGVVSALAPVQTGLGEAVAAVTSTSVERRVRSVLGGKGLAALPQLVAEVAIDVVTSPAQSHYVLITPPRELTVDPPVAERAILATSLTTWATPLPLRAAASSITPVERGLLRGRSGAPRVPAAAVRTLRYITDTLPSVAVPGPQRFYRTANATTAQLAAWPTAMQRCESTSLVIDDPQASVSRTARLRRGILAILRGVSLVPPSFGTYTLTSKNSALPVTVVNHLPDEVQVRIGIKSLFNRPGFLADGGKVQLRRIAGGAKTQFRIQTHVDSVGRYDLQVTLSTPDGIPLGTPINKLTVRSTALGTIGVVITVAAAVVLVGALLARLVRRIRRGRRSNRPTAVTTASA